MGRFERAAAYMCLVKLVSIAIFVVILPSASNAQNIYSRHCDTSAGIPVDNSHFLVEEDGHDILTLYSNENSAGEDSKIFPITQFDISKFLNIRPKKSDIEGATRRGDRIYWVTSHARDDAGKYRIDRTRLFATDISGKLPNFKIRFIGRFDKIVEGMLTVTAWDSPASQDTVQFVEFLKETVDYYAQADVELGPHRTGFSIEAVSVADSLRSGLLLFGLRSPLPDGRAIVIPLKNGDALITKKETVPFFGQPFMLDLGGLGIRALEYVPGKGTFLIVAGSSSDSGPFVLYKWDGARESRPISIADLGSADGVSPQSIVVYDDDRIQIIYDEGERLVDGQLCKQLARDHEGKFFKDLWYKIE